LQLTVNLLAGDPRQALYSFCLDDAHGSALVDGRAAVVLDAPTARRERRASA
jgi:hypothetical protein